MKRVFISQPMKDLTDEQILRKRDEICNTIKITIGEDVEIIDSFIKEYPGEINKQVPIWYLGKSIQMLSQADIAYFGGKWRQARGCKIENTIAKEYGLKVIEE